MWELKPEYLEETPPLKTEFSVRFSVQSDSLTTDNPCVYKCPFDIINYKVSSYPFVFWYFNFFIFYNLP